MSYTNRHLLGKTTRYDFHPKGSIPELAQCINICVTTDDTMSQQNQQATDGTRTASCQVITVVDPKMTSTTTELSENGVKKLMQLDRQSLIGRRNSSLDESIIFRSPKPVAAATSPLKRKHSSMKGQQEKANLTPTSSSAHGKKAPLSDRHIRVLSRKSFSAVPNSEKTHISVLRERIKRVSKAIRSGKEKSKHQPTAEDIEKSQTVNTKVVNEIASKISPQLALNIPPKKKPSDPGQNTKRQPVALSNLKNKKKPTKPKIEKKKKVNLRNFKQQIPIAGTNYMMEVYLAPDIIEKTRKGNIDVSREPKIRVNYTRGADLRDEFSCYCGQKKSIKNWLFYV